MARWILRYRGPGRRPDADVERLAAVPDVEILDDTRRTLLVAGAEEVLRSALAALPDWVMAAESTVPLPDVRRRPRKRS